MLLLFVLCVITAAAQPPNKLGRGPSAEKWLEDLRAANRGKWNEQFLLTGPLSHLSAVATKSLSEKWKEGTDCQRASGYVAFVAASDTYLKRSLQEMAKGSTKAVVNLIEGLSPATTLKKIIVELSKEGIKQATKRIQDLLAKEKDEVHVSTTTKENCQIVMVSIWHRSSSTYDVFIYGNCNCTILKSFTTREQIRVSTFEVRMQGKAYVDIDETQTSLVLKVEDPTTVSVNAECDTCKTATTGKPDTPKPPVETPPEPNPPTQKPTTPTADPCKMLPPCDACKAIYDRIVAKCNRLKAIPGEILHVPGERDSNKNRQDYARREIAEAEKQGATAKANKAKEDFKQLEKEAEAIEAKSNDLRTEPGRIQAELTSLTAELKTCEKDRCGKTATGNQSSVLDPCLVGSWVSQTSTKIDGAVGAAGIKMTVEKDRTITIVYDGMEAWTYGTGESQVLQSWKGTATGHISAGNGVIIQQSVAKSNDLTATTTQRGQATTRKNNQLGIVIVPAPIVNLYQCNETTLRIQSNWFGNITENFLFVRQVK